jgi:glutamate dehydrogenase (NADP+)
VLTGKGLNWGGSLIRPEATGYGSVYFAAEMLGHPRRDAGGQDLPGVRLAATWPSTPWRSCSTSGAKPGDLLRLAGYIYDEAGIDREKLAFVMELKNVRRGRIKEYAEKVPERGLYRDPPGPRRSTPLEPPGRLRLPSRPPRTRSTPGTPESGRQRRLCGQRGRQHAHGARGDRHLHRTGSSTVPGKAANAGGVAVSGLEMTQNSMRCQLDPGGGGQRLQRIMKSIHQTCVEAAEEFGTPGNYVNGANIAGLHDEGGRPTGKAGTPCWTRGVVWVP